MSSVCAVRFTSARKFSNIPWNFQVKRAEGHLLEALYGHITSLGKFETDSLLEEDPDTMQRRAATRKVHINHAASRHAMLCCAACKACQRCIQ